MPQRVFLILAARIAPRAAAFQRSTSLAWCGVRAVQGRLRDSVTLELLTLFQDGRRMLGACLREFEAALTLSGAPFMGPIGLAIRYPM